jgi:TonB family protein
MRTSLVLLALLAAGTLPCHATGAEPTGVLTRAPEVVAPAEPEYPAEARSQELTGEVTLELEISDQGEVTEATVTQPAGHGFDEAALEAARRLRFSPAEIDGKPSAVRIEYRFTFTLAQAPAPEPPAAPPANLKGRVLEMGTRLPVVAALVQAGGKSAYTDREGRFELAVPVGEVKVVITDAAHARYEVDEAVAEGKLTEVTYRVLRTATAVNETVVTGKREQREVSQKALSTSEIVRIAGVSGDTVKVVQNLPGVARAPFGAGQLVVRGGNPRDTQVYVDDLPVPAVFHFGGLTSIYSSELLQDVEFEPGGFGATHGRAIGGRVNLVTRDPGDRLHLVGDVNTYQATAMVEGRPSENVGMALAARRSYADFMIRQALKGRKDAPGLSVAPRYYDLQGKVAWRASSDDKVRLDFFGSDDRMAFTHVDTGGLTNLNVVKFGNTFYKANLRWDHRISDDTRLFLALGGGWQEVVAQFGDYYTETDQIWSTTFRGELHHRFSPAVDLVVGSDGLWDPSARVSVSAGSLEVPGQVSSGTGVLVTPNRFQKRLEGYELGAFAEAILEPLKGLRIVPGVRADAHRSVSSLTWADARLQASYQLDEATQVRAAAGLYHQAPPIAYLTKEWGNPDLRPEGSWQYSVGAKRRFLPQLSLDLDLYYKRLFDLALPTSEVVVRDGQQVPLHFVSGGTGKAYGAEVLLRWDPDGRFFGWIAYSLSRSLRDQSVSGGRLQREGSAYDQPHNLVVLGTVELPEVWNGLSSGFRLRYTSGNPYERIQGAVYDADGDAYQPITTGRYNARMPDFFQLDLRVDKKWTHRLWIMSVYLEVQNVTGRKNVEAPAYSFDYSKRGWVTGIPFFPGFGVRAEY